jgi:hypothetical protein
VRDEEHQIVGGIQVVLVPSLERRSQHDLYKTATGDKKGEFKIVGVAPGEYKLFALEGAEPDAYFDPDFMAPLENYGETIKVEENSRNTANLEVVPGY